MMRPCLFCTSWPGSQIIPTQDRSCGATIYPVLDKRHNSGGSGGLKGMALLRMSPPVIQAFFMIGPACRKKKLPNNTHYFT
jgi:hypothetical protein